MTDAAQREHDLIETGHAYLLLRSKVESVANSLSRIINDPEHRMEPLLKSDLRRALLTLRESLE